MIETIIIKKWITFALLDTPKRKTQIWQVVSNYGVFLGDIKWFPRWRTYSFFPEPDTVYEDDCLFDIANFIKELMEKRKNESCSL